MGIFKRRKADEAFKIQLEREALDHMNHPDEEDGYVLPLQWEGDSSAWNMQGKVKAPHTITAEELNGQAAKPAAPANVAAGTVEEIKMTKESALTSSSDFLFKRMSESRAQAAEQVIVPPTKPSANATEQATAPASATSVPAEPVASKPTEPPQKATETLDIDALLRSLHEELNLTKSNLAGSRNPQSTRQKEPEITQKSAEPAILPPTRPMPEQAPPQAVAPTKEKEVEQIPLTPATPPAVDPAAAKRAEERRTSLLARCNAYLKDEEFGTAKIDTEKYKLESVESILQDFEARASHRVQKNLDLKTGATSTLPVVIPPAVSDPVTSTISVTLPTVSAPSPTDKPSEPTTEITKQEPAPVKHYFSTPAAQKKQEPTVPDLSETKILTDISSSSTTQTTEGTDEQTTIFTAVEPTEAPKPNEPTVRAPQEDAYPDDYRSVADRERIAKELLRNRSRQTGKIIGNLLLLIPSVLLLTPLAETVKSVSLPLFCALEAVFALLAILINISTFKSIVGLFSSKADPAMPAAVAAIAVLLQSVVRLATAQITTGFSAALLLPLLIGSITKRSFYTRVLRNFELIANSADKKAVAIVKSQSATKAVVGNSISGGALICCGAETTTVKNFLKYTYSADPAAGKIKWVTVIGLAVGLVLGLIAGFAGGTLNTGFSVFAASLCVIATPAAFLPSHLPLNMAAGRLKLYDAMLTGHRAADELDLCNGIAVSCTDIFPEGTIRLVDMKLLSPNPIDKSMLDAAALADAIGSPLAGIFKQVNTASSYHKHHLKVDTMVYEDKMGISGWVDDRRVFVGNRILMEAHGFSNLPPVELDKKIMRKGYFPVYLVSDNVPCALLVVKYAPDEEIAYELRRLCNTGTTVFVHNCDPNISNQMLCDYFGLYPETVSVMSKQGAEQYQELVKYRREISAGAAYRGPVSGLFAALTAAISVKRMTTTMTTLYVVLAILGLLAIGISIFTPLFPFLNTISVLVYQLATTLLICLPPLLKRP